jgi:hypothetical protein
MPLVTFPRRATTEQQRLSESRRPGTERRPQKCSLVSTCAISPRVPPNSPWRPYNKKPDFAARPQFLHVSVVVTPKQTREENLYNLICVITWVKSANADFLVVEELTDKTLGAAEERYFAKATMYRWNRAMSSLRDCCE